MCQIKTDVTALTVETAKMEKTAEMALTAKASLHNSVNDQNGRNDLNSRNGLSGHLHELKLYHKLLKEKRTICSKMCHEMWPYYGFAITLPAFMGLGKEAVVGWR